MKTFVSRNSEFLSMWHKYFKRISNLNLVLNGNGFFGMGAVSKLFHLKLMYFNNIHIVNNTCYLKLKCMRVMKSHFQRLSLILSSILVHQLLTMLNLVPKICLSYI